MTDNSSQREEFSSQNDEVIVAENLPMIESGSESSSLNRFGKLVQKIGQNQWISELDIFSTPMKLNFNGDDTHKTQFGGLIYLTTAFICIFFTMTINFPNGLNLGKPITHYNLNASLETIPSIFEHTDTFFEILIYQFKERRLATAAEISFLFNHISVYHVNRDVITKLETSNNCKKGVACLKNTPLNQKVFLNGTGNQESYIKVEISGCQFMNSTPAMGTCLSGAGAKNFIYAIQFSSFRPTTGKIQETTTQVALKYTSANISSIINIDQAKFQTNTQFFGHLANVMNYDITYYKPQDMSYRMNYPLPILDSTGGCMGGTIFTGRYCVVLKIGWSGLVKTFTQQFQDLTTPIIFFLSLMETFFFLLYIIVIKNYANNALFLKIADSLTYLEDNTGRHHNFKSGPAVFFACLIHNNIITKGIDILLFKGCETQIKRMLPLKSQLTIKMIDYGQKCLGQEMIFDQMNKAYQQENLQPTKIIFEDEKEDSQLTEKENSVKEQESEESLPYFINQIDEEAFKRMCKDHEFYSTSRKRHLAFILKRTEKTFKLALHAQSLFENYRAQVKLEYASKEVQLPIGFNNEDQSAMYLQKSNLVQ